MKNLAFIDAQNLRRGTTDDGWMVNHRKFRTFLKERYHVEIAYYHMGYFSKEHRALYERIQAAEFEVVFKATGKEQKSRKKGNVDVDIVFNIMDKLFVEKYPCDKVVLVSGDGDFYPLVKRLVSKGRFEKILFPNRKPSWLYRKLGGEYCDFLDRSKKDIAERGGTRDGAKK